MLKFRIDSDKKPDPIKLTLEREPHNENVRLLATKGDCSLFILTVFANGTIKHHTGNFTELGFLVEDGKVVVRE